MFEIMMDALESLKQDETIIDVLNTTSAAALSLADETLSPVEYLALNFVIREADKRIKEIVQNKLNKYKPAEQ